MGRPFYDLAAAAVVVAATTVVIIGNAVVATAAEQDQQDDDPAHIPATETIVIHRKYLRKFFCGNAAHSKIFPGIKYVRLFLPITAEAGPALLLYFWVLTSRFTSCRLLLVYKM